MNLQNDTIIGIVGGMGPQAGHALFENITRYTQASADQHHLSVVLMSLPKYIGDRTAFINQMSGINPAYAIAEVIQKLEHAGASVVGIACNTSHAPEIFNVIRQELDKMGSRVKLLNMPLETCDFVAKKYPHIKRVGLMTTNGTYKSTFYKHHLQRLGYDVVVPDLSFQDNVIHRMIYDPVFGIKSKPNISDEVHELMAKAMLYFLAKRTEAIILGCTELSLVLSGEYSNSILIIDSTKALALALIREATTDSLPVHHSSTPYNKNSAASFN